MKALAHDYDFRLQNALNAQMVTIEELSDETGVPADRIREMCAGEYHPRQSKAQKIEEALGIKLYTHIDD